ncbi:hypothetical protein [Flavobacterium hydrophilum]|uniref:Uncharacterized protein n=1 Tax=Flavobacterium hydrophilum TaxID=2211445 RepID=A0A2V4C7M8_9FLAO|nr:hypothetical protein [Flavobacterium hydrophilum]PXY46997.1 hypothetical protein DMB68_07575 [Flavobacterium hydrophilum]
MNNWKEMLFADNVYCQLLFVCILLTVIVLISRLSETVIIKSGIYLFAVCLIINFMLSFFSEHYWYFVLHWFLSSVCFFIYWHLTIYICENFGLPYSGDGAMVMVLPVYFLPVAILGSVIIKGVTVLIQRF